MQLVFNPISGAFDFVGAGGGSGQEWANNVTPTPSPNGIVTLFNVGGTYITGTLEVYLNGVLQKQVDDYSETSPTTFTFASPPQTTDRILLGYRIV